MTSHREERIMFLDSFDSEVPPGHQHLSNGGSFVPHPLKSLSQYVSRPVTDSSGVSGQVSPILDEDTSVRELPSSQIPVMITSSVFTSDLNGYYGREFSSYVLFF